MSSPFNHVKNINSQNIRNNNPPPKFW
jgi:hypothetical protein